VCFYEEGLREMKPDLDKELLRELAWEASKGSEADSSMPLLMWQPSIPVMQLRQEGFPAPVRPVAVSEFHFRVYYGLFICMGCLCCVGIDATSSMQLQAHAYRDSGQLTASSVACVHTPASIMVL
jgi:hypothetical protein